MRSSSRPSAPVGGGEAGHVAGPYSLPPVAEASADKGLRVGAVAGCDRVDDDLRLLRRFVASSSEHASRRSRPSVSRTSILVPADIAAGGTPTGRRRRRARCRTRLSGVSDSDCSNSGRIGAPGVRVTASLPKATTLVRSVFILLQERRRRALGLPQRAPAHRPRVVDGEHERLARAELARANVR